MTRGRAEPRNALAARGRGEGRKRRGASPCPRFPHDALGSRWESDTAEVHGDGQRAETARPHAYSTDLPLPWPQPLSSPKATT